MTDLIRTILGHVVATLAPAPAPVLVRVPAEHVAPRPERRRF